MRLRLFIRHAFLVSCLAVAVGGCQPKPTPTPTPRLPVDDTVATVVDGNTDFAFDVYAQMRPPVTENLFFSPFSISTALAMTYAGARGQTESEMASVLHFELPHESLHPGFGALAGDLIAADKNRPYDLSIANRLWCRDGDTLLEPYVAITRDDYGAEVEQLDFAADTEGARRRINDWVEDNTNDRIQELLAAGVLSPSTVMVLTNAIYFKGDWEIKFKEENTAPAEFHVTADRAVTVPLMYQHEAFKYADVDGVQILELPYKGNELSMIVLLPKTVNDLDALEQQLSRDALDGWIGALNKQDVDVWLPKFKLTIEYRLNDVLAQMGMPTAFTGAADFSGISGRQDRSISDVIHKAFVEVNEEGTEAAAATAVVMDESASMSHQFRADRPFVFSIRDVHTGSLLFMGRVANPE